MAGRKRLILLNTVYVFCTLQALFLILTLHTASFLILSCPRSLGFELWGSRTARCRFPYFLMLGEAWHTWVGNVQSQPGLFQSEPNIHLPEKATHPPLAHIYKSNRVRSPWASFLNLPEVPFPPLRKGNDNVDSLRDYCTSDDVSEEKVRKTITTAITGCYLQAPGCAFYQPACL